MIDPEASDDPTELERALAGRPGREPPPAFRARVMGAVSRELGADRRRERWAFAARVAAAALLWLNLSLSATIVAAPPLPAAPNGRAAAEAAEQLRRLLPEMPREQALAYAAMLRAGSGVLTHPTATPLRPPRGALTNEPTH